MAQELDLDYGVIPLGPQAGVSTVFWWWGLLLQVGYEGLHQQDDQAWGEVSAARWLGEEAVV